MAKLTKPALRHQAAFLAFEAGWAGPLIPSACDRKGLDYPAYLERLAREEDALACPAGLVPASLYFWSNEAETEFYGALHLRHFLNPGLRHYGGHIGYGVLPACRGQGIAVQMLQAALPLARGKNLERVLLTCDRENLPSVKTIQRCGGVLEAQWEEQDVCKQRYWVPV